MTNILDEIKNQDWYVGNEGIVNKFVKDNDINLINVMKSYCNLQRAKSSHPAEIKLVDNSLNKYSGFVDTLLSEPSKNLEILIHRLRELNNKCNIAELMTGAHGLSSESGELMEIVKKVMYQGKPFNDETKFHILRELGDIAFYLMTTALALNLDPTEILNENIKKLESRYPGGKFNAWHSENRKTGDL